MSSSIFTADDLRQLAVAGISPEDAHEQIRFLTDPPRYARVVRPCVRGDGIRVLTSGEIEEALASYERARAENRLLKFVPASGAATRLFQSLLWFLREKTDYPSEVIEAERRRGGAHFGELALFLQGLRGTRGPFAFRDRLAEALREEKHDLSSLVEERRYRPVLRTLLDTLGYASLPKGLIPFHEYDSGVRTPFEEHLAEASLYARNSDGVCRLHFTVSPEHERAFREHLGVVGPAWEERLGVRYEVGFSAQKPSTDTLAVDGGGRPFREASGRLLLRPGGHGALLENLSDLEGDIVFIKNIDNVSPRQLQDDLVTWKKTLAGLLVHLQEKAFRVATRLETGDDQALTEAETFGQEYFGVAPRAGNEGRSAAELRRFWTRKLGRPIRVCGMVPNAGHAGGGPFWVRGADGSVTPQVVETAEFDPDSEEQQAILQVATHFSPVDFVCALRDRHGESHDLKRFVDRERVFVSSKSHDGRQLRALERPGLWNGGMADWNSVFVEVPAESFAPVKRITDLLNDAHQAHRR
jgi:hypothetical protein